MVEAAARAGQGGKDATCMGAHWVPSDFEAPCSSVEKVKE